MPRFFVNSMANFMIQGGIVGFTLQDQAMRTEGGQPIAATPEDVADIVMREQDFAKLLQFLNQHAAAFEQQHGRPVGGAAYAAKAQAEHPIPEAAASEPSGTQGNAESAGLTIRPRET